MSYKVLDDAGAMGIHLLTLKWTIYNFYQIATKF